MEQVNNLVGNPTTLLIERIFWLGLGGFLGLAIITSAVRQGNERKNKTKHLSADELKNQVKKAIQQKVDLN